MSKTPLFPQDLISLYQASIQNGITPPHIPPGYVIASDPVNFGPLLPRLFDAAFITTGIIDPNRLGTGSTGAGNLYLADDGTWKAVPIPATPNLQQVTDVGSTTTNAITTNGVTSDYFTFDTSATPTPTTGMMFWDQDSQTPDVQLDSALAAKMFQDEFWYVKNQTGSTIPKGTVVMAVGTLGASSRILVAPMIANGSVSAKYILGIAAENIPDGGDGSVMRAGKIRQLNTTAFADGDVLYANPAVAGGLTNVLPQAPNLKLAVAFVVHAANNGVLAVRVEVGSDLYEDHRVQVSSPTDRQALIYDASTSRWINEDPKDILNSTLLTNQSVGGVSSGITFSAGTPLETVVRNILVSYIPPSFNTLRAKNVGTTLSTGTYEVGTVFTVTNMSVNVVVDNPNGDPPSNVSISVSGAQTGDGTIASGLTVVGGTNSSLPVTSGNYTRNTNGSVTFTISGLDANSVTRSTTQSYSFQSYNYFGGASTVVNSDATATSVRSTIQSQRKAFDTNRAWSTTGTTQTNDPANFTYIMYPAAYGDLSSVLLGATPVLGAFTKIGDFNILTENGNVTVSYRVYKSNATGAFSNGASLTIS